MWGASGAQRECVCEFFCARRPRNADRTPPSKGEDGCTRKECGAANVLWPSGGERIRLRRPRTAAAVVRCFRFGVRVFFRVLRTPPSNKRHGRRPRTPHAVRFSEPLLQRVPAHDDFRTRRFLNMSDHLYCIMFRFAYPWTWYLNREENVSRSMRECKIIFSWSRFDHLIKY